ncbi:MAG: RNA-binding S4 domain-containing protein [Bacillota bacterium]|nr:RNA-binding S4 domain-containing protein [Bacillota bacterium]
MEFKLTEEFITLSQLLKTMNIVSSGGEAKVLIQSGLVKVNQTICTQRGKKIRAGDKVQVERELNKVNIEVLG